MVKIEEAKSFKIEGSRGGSHWVATRDGSIVAHIFKSRFTPFNVHIEGEVISFRSKEKASEFVSSVAA